MEEIKETTKVSTVCYSLIRVNHASLLDTEVKDDAEVFFLYNLFGAAILSISYHLRESGER